MRSDSVDFYKEVYGVVEIEPNTECNLCFEALEDSKDETTAPIELVCFHSFHSECIARWFERATTCPVCRRDILEMRDNYETHQRYQEYEQRKARVKSGRRHKVNHRKGSEE